MRKKAKKDSINFYDVFKIGIEIEGEFIKRIDRGGFTMFEVDEDGSLRNMFGGNCLELRSKIIDSEEKEKTLLNELKNLETQIEEGRKQFAYMNKTAGTHIHFSFSSKYKRQLKELSGMDKDNYLYLFDSVEFEKYFFQRYFTAFNLSKFWNRLQNEYCQPFIQFNQVRNNKMEIIDNIPLGEIESRKRDGRNRYHWLNNECLKEGEGMEIRIFPHLLTTKGVEDVIKFVREVLVAYLVKKKTQALFEKIQKFFEIKAKYKFNETKLKKYDRVLFYSLFGARDVNYLSMDFIEFYVYLFEKNKKAFELVDTGVNTPF